MQNTDVPNAPQNNQSETVDAPIVAVTVYSDRARITRRGRVMLEAGSRELLIGNLPANLDLNSLRAAGRGDVAVKILSVESRELPLDKTPHQAAREVQAELEKVQDEGASLTKRDEVLQQRLQTLRELAEKSAGRYARTLAENQTSLEAAGQLLDFIETQSSQVHAQRAALEQKRRENGARQVTLQNRLKQLRSARQRSVQNVVVAVEAAGGGEWELEVSYVVPGARWMPLYDARLQLLPPADPTGLLEGKLQLSYLAKVEQNTGENWDNVALTLSTARPGLGTLPPKLDPIYVDVPRSVAAPRRYRAAGRVAESAESDESISEMLDMLAPVEKDPTAAPAAAAPVEAQHESAEVKSEGATVTFELPRRMSVPADGQPHRATIAGHEFPCRLIYQAVPRRTEWAYLRATIENHSQLTLLAGEVNIFRDDTFVGAAQLEFVAPGQEFKLFLGPDEQVHAKRELARRDVEKNLVGNVRRQTLGYRIAIENLKPHRVNLLVLDQVPVSRHEQIKVKLRHADPQPEVTDLGELRWEFTMAPGSKREVTYDYTVESPRDMTVTGVTD
ncbi:MAG TPA: mucoidy inhibitor MuiA family protein [Abditibacteriaceae bacterium]|nr:mucoidy inhibitor MuiA family protein [Abditibacteriaceae bacterium]